MSPAQATRMVCILIHHVSFAVYVPFAYGMVTKFCIRVYLNNICWPEQFQSCICYIFKYNTAKSPFRPNNPDERYFGVK